jgi:hypothetical protein
VYFGFSLAFIRGVETMKFVEATIRVICARDAGRSNAFTAGVIPNSCRIHAA